MVRQTLNTTVLVLAVFVSSGVYAQNAGVQFEQKLSWQQIQEKAKSEDKYIFVDCYASWCLPCKVMEREVYPMERVGNFMNSKFISVKVQLDSSKMDDSMIRKWYPMASYLKIKYAISSFPTYLVFSSDGRILYKDQGARSADAFLSLVNQASQFGRQYYADLEAYRLGVIDKTRLPDLAKMAKTLNEQLIADEIAHSYIEGYLSGLADSELFKKENFNFVLSYYQTIKPQDLFFKILWNRGDTIDKVMSFKGISRNLIDVVIQGGEVQPIIDGTPKGQVPNWGRAYRNIKFKYGVSYADRIILNEKIYWAEKSERWSDFSKGLIDKMKKYGPGDYLVSATLNDNAFDIFLHSNRRKYLKTALSWVDQALVMNKSPRSDQLDTKANLLYKLGERKQAIFIESEAENIEVKRAVAANRKPNRIYGETLDKMKSGIPTWPIELTAN